MNQYLTTFLIGVATVSGCKPEPNETLHKSEIPEPVHTKNNMHPLAGNWISYGSTGFSLFQINPDSTGTFIAYHDFKKEFSKKRFSQRYNFMEGPIIVRYRPYSDSGKVIHIPNIQVQIWVNDGRNDYELVGDTLYEIDKAGYQGRWVRLHSTELN